MKDTRMPYEALKLTSGTFQNPRTFTGLRYEELAELAVNIGVVGLLNLPIVRPDGLIVAGSRRYRAIGLLLAWFAIERCGCRPGGLGDTGHAVNCSVWARMLALADLEPQQIDRVREIAAEFRDQGVPVRVRESEDVGGIALTDNVQRSDLSSYEIAESLDRLMHDQDLTQAELSRLVGKSKTWVSRKLAAWKGAGPELRAAWMSGEVTEDVVQDLARCTHADQKKQLSGPIPRGRRGPANRPSIETVKETLAKIDDEKRAIKYAAVDTGSYTAGVIDALRWVNGNDTSGAFAKLMEVIDAAK